MIHVSVFRPSVVIEELDLEKYVRKWQRILRMQDWEILAEIVSHDVISSLGDCQVYPRHHAMKIRLLAWTDIAVHQNPKWPVDMEQTLVHEMLHGLLDVIEPNPKDELRYNLWEQSVERMSTSLIALERGMFHVKQ